MYENYGGKRPQIPAGWEEVEYRVPKGCETFISPTTGYIIAYGPGDYRSERVIVRRKPVIDPALVAPQGYQFRLDEYGRPVCRAPRDGEIFLEASGRTTCRAGSNWLWAEARYILDPIPTPPKMTIVEAAKAAESDKSIRRRAWPGYRGSIGGRGDGLCSVAMDDALADDWEVVP